VALRAICFDGGCGGGSGGSGPPARPRCRLAETRARGHAFWIRGRLLETSRAGSPPSHLPEKSVRRSSVGGKETAFSGGDAGIFAAGCAHKAPKICGKEKGKGKNEHLVRVVGCGGGAVRETPDEQGVDVERGVREQRCIRKSSHIRASFSCEGSRPGRDAGTNLGGSHSRTTRCAASAGPEIEVWPPSTPRRAQEKRKQGFGGIPARDGLPAPVVGRRASPETSGKIHCAGCLS